jgi:ubiquinone/menaquinone biosynthesis C-methylase UbiE
VEPRNNSEILQELLDLPGKRVLDVGCGPGVLVRQMTGSGAKVAGLECGALPLAKAQAEEPVGVETYVEGVGENMPFDDAAFDIVVFFKSFHHVPVVDQEKALSEAVRVLVSGGLVYISEPLAEGSSFELGRLLEDETEVRAAAYGVIEDAPKLGLTETQEVTYVHVTKQKDFEAFRDAKILVDADREQIIRVNEDELREKYQRFGRKTENGQEFDQPMRVNLLQKSA